MSTDNAPASDNGELENGNHAPAPHPEQKKEPGNVTFSKNQIPESGKEIIPEVEN